ncbi:MAG TPA: pyridoxamine 5'-phosphate oxidase family protein [Planosporangium sp.]|nr:pyridoxamine 5'-phosphate oxidase family protein [Planosporangium sp.]
MDRTNAWPGSAGEHRLQEQYGTAERAQRFYSQQMLDHLNERMREFVAEQEMMFVATSDAHGECDNTFRAGPPGFVRVLDDQRLTWPEYRGNGVMASLGNISENAHVGLLFMDFTRQVIGLHVNGRATIIEDAEMRSEYEDLAVDDIPGRSPERWVVVEVEEAYIHCAKHIPRLVKAPRERAWGTDDVRRKGGDFFHASGEQRPWEPAAAPARGVPAQRPEGSTEQEPPEVPDAARMDEAARSAGATAAADVAAALADGARRGPGRHRRLMGLLGHAPRCGEGR